MRELKGRACLVVLLLFTIALGAQNQNINLESDYFQKPRPVTTAVPFLLIAPDSRAGALGDVGAATLPDANSIHWNSAKLAFLPENTNTLSLSYNPWLRRLVPDINLAYLSYAHKLSDRQALGFSLRYFSLGEVNYTDDQGNQMGTFEPNEFAISGAYALKLSENLGLAVALRYIRSDLTQGQQVAGTNTKAGQSFASDISGFYKSDEFNLERGQKAYWAAGMNISNIGAKIAYTESGNSDFLPANMRLGGNYTMIFDEYNSMSLLMDVNKLLVPTRPQRDDEGEVIFGREDDVTALQGVFQSFSDAPGGFREEMREILWNFGLEYWYDEKFAFRGGYQYEHETKGNRKYFTMGIGIKYNVFGLDFAYLLPATANVNSPLENTLRFTLNFNFGDFEEQN